tara:strand:+ start:2477 stop:2830 length:354 start_codon:yes stop_codon:yes gene_type:complete
MGSRTSWEIRTGDETSSIYLYSHWGGDSKWSDTLAALTAAEPRWTDVSYGARIFISQIIANNWGEETGFGISSGKPGDSPFEESYFPMVVDFSTQTVIVGSDTYAFGDVARVWQFAD